MSDDAVPPGTPQEVALQTILRSIAVRDRSTAGFDNESAQAAYRASGDTNWALAMEKRFSNE